MTAASTRELMGRKGGALPSLAHRTADRHRTIADAIDVMLTGLDAGSETLVGTGASESVGDGQAHGEGMLADF
jgi:hypothetical protein